MKSGDVGRHCGLKRLIAYREGTLSAAEREEVQEHLSLCPRCTGLLRELGAFEAAAARGEAGPEPLRQEAWNSLVRRLPAKTPALRPVPSAAPGEPRQRFPRFVPAATAAIAALLLLAIAGLALWAAVMVFQERQRMARLERRLDERDAAVAALQSSLAETERELDAARRQIQDLEKEQAGGRLSEKPESPEKRDRVAVASPMVSREIEISIAPRYVLRGHQAPGDAFLREGTVSSVRPDSTDHRFIVALDLARHPAHDEYRFELIDRKGKVLWSGRRPGASVLGDDGTSVSIRGLGPGLYRLRIAGLKGERLAEYRLQIES